MTRLTNGLAAVLVGLLLAVLPVAGPAAAQSDNLQLDVAGDGATGVTVQVTDSEGNRPAQVIRLVLTATGADGQTVGPMQLQPAGEGQGFYSTGPILQPGDWQVTVSAPAPYVGEVTVDVRAVPAESPPPPPTTAASDADADTAGGTWLLRSALALLALAGLAGLGTAVMVLLARRNAFRRN
ncbi:hypothetical protein [Micromonospora sp. NBC_01813]|uniref:hypothetical protein n=1 Tax=Micromonospora sp. NBC_01813 TaxID=2975988 RepID=UPI002DD7BC2A|nr:hypothetical protein [Micromonospora sp. NBC_01813]WSA06378.1 hypothetical protein OG958_18855 [Micromonospora sp. NBC_01813]